MDGWDGWDGWVDGWMDGCMDLCSNIWVPEIIAYNQYDCIAFDFCPLLHGLLDTRV